MKFVSKFKMKISKRQTIGRSLIAKAQKREMNNLIKIKIVSSLQSLLNPFSKFSAYLRLNLKFLRNIRITLKLKNNNKIYLIEPRKTILVNPNF